MSYGSDHMINWFLSLKQGLSFFTRIPCGPIQPIPLSESASLFPVIGLVIGLLASLIILFALAIGLPTNLSILLGLAAAILITGGLHEDGLADTADALGVRGDKDKRIAVLRDSRIGTFGALALIVSISIKWAALSDLASSWQIITYFISAHILGRGILPSIMRSSPLLLKDGQAAAAGIPESHAARIALILSFLLVTILLGPAKGLVAFAAALLAAYLVIKMMVRWFGGYNGDILGATEQLIELAVLINLRSFGI